MAEKFHPEAIARDLYEFVWRDLSKELVELIPVAELEHVGSTSVNGAWTNGEVDIQVRVPADEFADADKVLAKRFERSDDRPGGKGFALYRDNDRRVTLLLCEMDSPADLPHRHRDRFIDQPLLRERYDSIKRRHQDVDPADYRAAKNKFWDENPI